MTLFFVIVLIVEIVLFPIAIYLKYGIKGVVTMIIFVSVMEIIGFICDGKEKSKEEKKEKKGYEKSGQNC